MTKSSLAVFPVNKSIRLRWRVGMLLRHLAESRIIICSSAGVICLSFYDDDDKTFNHSSRSVCIFHERCSRCHPTPKNDENVFMAGIRDIVEQSSEN